MKYLGLDIASDNPGYSIISDSRDILFSKTIRTPADAKISDVTKASFQLKALKTVLSFTDVSVICVEAPAFSFSNQMVSIGHIHGAIMSYLLTLNKPIVYVPPTKWKYALLGKGNAEKKVGVDFVLENFRFAKGLDLKHFDNNQADAAMLAHIAYVFDSYLKDFSPSLFSGTEKRIKEIFTSEKYSSFKKSGILYRKNEFYFNATLPWE